MRGVVKKHLKPRKTFDIPFKTKKTTKTSKYKPTQSINIYKCKYRNVYLKFFLVSNAFSQRHACDDHKCTNICGTFLRETLCDLRTKNARHCGEITFQVPIFS